MSADGLETGSLLADRPGGSVDRPSVSFEELGRTLERREGEDEASRPKLWQATVVGLVGFAVLAMVAAARWRAAPWMAAVSGPSSVDAGRQQRLYAQIEDTCGKAETDVDYIFEGEWLLLVGSVSTSERCCHLCLAQEQCCGWTWTSNASKVEGSAPGQCWLKGGTLVQKLPKPGLISARAERAEA